MFVRLDFCGRGGFLSGYFVFFFAFDLLDRVEGFVLKYYEDAKERVRLGKNSSSVRFGFSLRCWGRRCFRKRLVLVSFVFFFVGVDIFFVS